MYNVYYCLYIFGGFNAMIKFLNDFDKAEYSLGSLNDFKNKNTG